MYNALCACVIFDNHTFFFVTDNDVLVRVFIFANIPIYLCLIGITLLCCCLPIYGRCNSGMYGVAVHYYIICRIFGAVIHW